MRDVYGLAAFRSRQQVLRFEARLNRQGIPARVISTPREISMGCGLSVRFPLEHAQSVRQALAAGNAGNLIGFYRAEYEGGRLRLSPLSGR